MENALQIFKNEEFGTLRTLSLNGEPYAVGNDVAKALGYERPRKAIEDHVDQEDKIIINEKILKEMAAESKRPEMEPLEFAFDSPRGLTFINESGLYSLILSSKLPTAKKFKRWVTSVVLPSIRKTGGYKAENVWTDKEKAEMLKEFAALATDDSLRYSILKEATEFVTGRPLIVNANPAKVMPFFNKKNLYDSAEVEKFMKTWLAKNFFHIAERNGVLPALEPEKGFYQNGRIIIYPVETFKQEVESAGFEDFLKFLDTLIDNKIMLKANCGRKKKIRRKEKVTYGIELKGF